MLPEDVENKIEHLIPERTCYNNDSRELHRFTGTYDDLIQEVHAWTTDTECPSRFLHITGPLAIGKSTFSKAIAGKSNATALAGSFFFWNRVPERASVTGLPVTLICELADLIDEACEHITNTIREDPNVLYAPVEEQWQKLIVQSLESIKSPLSFRPVFVIDGVDECASLEDQTWVLEKLVELCVRFSVVVVTSSRGGPYITKELCRLETLHPTLFHAPVVLGELEKNNARVMDVTLPGLYNEFMSILENGDDPVAQRIKRIWRCFMDDAAGQYWIIELTARYMMSMRGDDGDSLTVEMLETMLYNEEVQARVYSPLDDRYDHFMSSMGSNEQQMIIRNELLYHLLYLHPDPISAISTFWNRPADQILRVLDHMRPVLRIPASPASEPITFYFPSFRSFLSSKLRGGEGHRFCISIASSSIKSFEHSIVVAQQRGGLPAHLLSLWLIAGPRIDVPSLDQTSRQHIVRLLTEFDFRSWIWDWYLSQPQTLKTEYDIFRRWAAQLAVPTIMSKFTKGALRVDKGSPGKLIRLYRKLFPNRRNSSNA